MQFKAVNAPKRSTNTSFRSSQGHQSPTDAAGKYQAISGLTPVCQLALSIGQRTLGLGHDRKQLHCSLSCRSVDNTVPPILFLSSI